MRATNKVRFSRQEWEILLILSIIQFCNVLDFVLMMPLGPVMMREFELTPEQFGNVFAAYGIAAGLAALAGSFFIDRFDRKHALLVLLIGFGISTAGCGLAHNYYTMLAARIAAGIFGGVLGSIVMAIVGDLFANERRGSAMGMVMTAFAVATVAGVPIGLQLEIHFGLGAPFTALAALCGLILPLIWFVFPNINGHRLRKRTPPIEQFLSIIGNKSYLVAYLFGMTVVSGGFLVVPFLPNYLESNVGLAHKNLQYVYLVSGACTIVSMNVIGRLSDYYGKKPVFRVVAACAVVMSLTFTNLPPASLLVCILAATGFMVFTSGRMVPGQALITNVAQAHERGSFLSLNTAVMHFSMGLAAKISGLFVIEGPNKELLGYPIAGYVSACLALLSLILVGFLHGAPAAQPVQQIGVSGNQTHSATPDLVVETAV